MSDGELARAFAEFLEASPSTESVAALGRQLDPTSPLGAAHHKRAGNGRADCVLISPSHTRRLNMPVWLDILLNISGYAGFVALATHGSSCQHVGADDPQ
jgi:hypothetical protein